MYSIHVLEYYMLCSSFKINDAENNAETSLRPAHNVFSYKKFSSACPQKVTF